MVWEGDCAPFPENFGTLFLEMLHFGVHFSNHYLWPLAHWGSMAPVAPSKYALEFGPKFQVEGDVPQHAAILRVGKLDAWNFHTVYEYWQNSHSFCHN